MKPSLQCRISGQKFVMTDIEQNLRKVFGFNDSFPSIKPKYRFRELGAFWPHWNLHKRKCNRTGKQIISIFRPDCLYPIWKRDEWISHANPPCRDFDFSQSFFTQAWELFQKCPLPHNFQSHNENCEYTDDWYRSKNCYLCHSGQGNEDCRYCYGCDSLKDVFYGVLTFNTELCLDIIGSKRCFDSFFILNCKNIQNSGFLYDCRNCKNCLFCFNLRNKEYCFGNKQLTKNEFEEKKKIWDFSSRKKYAEAKKFFAQMMKEMAWHRALQIDKSENSTGNFLRNTKDCQNCYMLTYHENCANVAFCGPMAKSILDSLGTVGSELIFYSSLPVYSYEVKFSFSVDHSRFIEYSAYLHNCEYCFGCCGLVNEKYHIFNKKYQKEEYFSLRDKIIAHMKKTGEWGTFFPGYFAPNPYDESYSGYHFPLSEKEKKEKGFQITSPCDKNSQKTAEIKDIPDSLVSLTPEKEKWLLEQIFWDKEYERSFQIQQKDIDFSRKLNTALPDCCYINRIQDNFHWMPFTGELRETTCAKSGKKIPTNWPSEYDGRVLSEEEYLKLIR